MTTIPIVKGTAARLGLRKPTGVYRYRNGSTVYIDEARRWMETLGFHLEPWRQDHFERLYLNVRTRPRPRQLQHASHCG